jgi:hypothetical protein
VRTPVAEAVRSAAAAAVRTAVAVVRIAAAVHTPAQQPRYSPTSREPTALGTNPLELTLVRSLAYPPAA